MQLGGLYKGDNRADFTVWAPYARSILLHIVSPFDALIPLHPAAHGYWHTERHGIPPDISYYFQIDNVHGQSSLVDYALYLWNDTRRRGPGSLSPDILVRGAVLTLQPRSFAVYSEEGGDA